MGRGERARINKWASALLASTLVCLAVYLAVPHAGFVFDDTVTILHNRMVQDSPASAVRENPFRSLTNLTFWLQHKLHRPAFAPMTLADALPRIEQSGGERLRPIYRDPSTGDTVPVTIDRERGMVYPLPPAWPFRLFNLLLHVLNGWLLFHILRRLGFDEGTSAFAAAAFLLHPLATEPVNYITARFALMAATFSLAATLAHLRADGRKRGEFIALGFYILALFSKETAAPLPLMLFVLDVVRGRPRPLVLASLAVTAAYALARSQWLVVLSARPGETLDWPLYLLAQQRVFWLYLGKVFVPVGLNFDYHLVSRPMLDGAIALLNLVLLGAAAIFLLRLLTVLRTEPKPPRAGEGSPAGPAEAVAAVLVLCWLALSPTSTVIPLADLAREDRAYPLLFIVIPAAAIAVARLLALLNPARRRAAVVFVLSILFLLAAGTVAHNGVWRDELTLHRDIVSKSPLKPRAVYNYATALKWHGRLPEALAWYERTLTLDPSHENARVNAAALRRILKP